MMETEGWIQLWTIFFFASLVIFTLLAIAVTIGGFFDLRFFFKGLRENCDENDSDEQSGAGEEGHE